MTDQRLHLRTNGGDANSCGVELLSTVPIHPGLSFYEMGICFTQVGPTGCGFPGLSTSGWRMSAKGTGSIITAC